MLNFAHWAVFSEADDYTDEVHVSKSEAGYGDEAASGSDEWAVAKGHSGVVAEQEVQGQAAADALINQ